jgi:hypothetical protein
MQSCNSVAPEPSSRRLIFFMAAASNEVSHGSEGRAFFGVILTALALVPAGAHFFELPNKIDLAQDHYFIVQKLYRGWALFGIVVVAALAINLVLALMLRGRGSAVLARSRGAPLYRGRAGDPLLLYLSGQRGDQQLDRRAGELDRAAHAVGILMRRAP